MTLHTSLLKHPEHNVYSVFSQFFLTDLTEIAFQSRIKEMNAEFS